jgi:hypothetical protein
LPPSKAAISEDVEVIGVRDRTHALADDPQGISLTIRKGK